jgi:CheY-like chemotaxis protein
MSFHAHLTELKSCVRKSEQVIASLPKDNSNISSESLKNEDLTFYPLLPLNPISSEKEDKKVLKDKSPEIIKQCILLVEDNLINQRLTKMILEKAGFKVMTANNGQEAVDRYQSKNEIKLIVMDVHMPILDGLSAAKLIRIYELDKKLNRTPIIALTANASNGDKEKCIEAGCDNYFSKPVMIDFLINTIKKYILNQ